MKAVSYRSRDEREMVMWARKRGWFVISRNAMGHLELQHENGNKTRVPSKMDAHLVRRIRKQILAAEG